MKDLKFIGYVTEEFRNTVSNSHSSFINWNGENIYIEIIKDTLVRLPKELLISIELNDENHTFLMGNHKGYTFSFGNYGYGAKKKLSFNIYDNRFKYDDIQRALSKANKDYLLDTPNFFKAPKFDKLQKALDMRIEAHEITQKYIDANTSDYEQVKAILLNAGFEQWRDRFSKTLKFNEFVSIKIELQMDINGTYLYIVNSGNSTNLSVVGDTNVLRAQRISEFANDIEEQYKKAMGL